MSQNSVKVIVVSNAGKGFGRSIALAYGQAGYDVVCIDDEVDLASKTAAEIEDQGGKAIPIQADVSSSMDVRKAFDKIFELFGSFAGIVHVASFENKSRFISLTESEFAEVVSKGLKSSFLVLRSAARFLEDVWLVLVTPPKSAKEPHMVASRGAIVELSKSFKDRYPNLRINVITPSRPAADSKHDAILVENVRYLSSASSGLSGHHLEVELPPPPKVVESLLPEVQAALDDDVRQVDLEESLYEFADSGEEDDELLDDELLNDFDDFDDLATESGESEDTLADNEDFSEAEFEEDVEELELDIDAESLTESETPYIQQLLLNTDADDLQEVSEDYLVPETSEKSLENDSYLAENYDLKLVKDIERINRKDGD